MRNVNVSVGDWGRDSGEPHKAVKLFSSCKKKKLLLM